MDLRIGDIVQIKAHQRIPADLVFLYSADPSGSLFLKTDLIDGETDWKLRRACALTQLYLKSPAELTRLGGLTVKAPEPMPDIYKFQGVAEFNQMTEGLELVNSGWANTVLASGQAWGVVVYTGRELRTSLNSKEPRTKFGNVDLELNRLSKVLFVAMCLLSLGLLLMKGVGGVWPAVRSMVLNIVLLSHIIPISMRISLDFAKLYYSWLIDSDSSIRTTAVRNSSIPEELGRIKVLLSDKTGTLTTNTMTFKKLALETGSFTSEDVDYVRARLDAMVRQGRSPAADPKAGKKSSDQLLLDLVFAVAICHSVTPIDEEGVRGLQASSPDEIALIQFVESVGVRLQRRSQTQIVLKAGTHLMTFKVLMLYPFSSEAKRMSIVVLTPEGRTVLYVKGADVELKTMVQSRQVSSLLDYTEQLANQGLRTMVVAQRVIPDAEWLQMVQRNKEVKANLTQREQLENQFRRQFEAGMQFLGVTGVEDKLQEDVKNTLESLRRAGISFWMLTGDKVETAICIAISTGIKAHSQPVFSIRDVEEKDVLLQKLKQFQKLHSPILVIDGTSVKTALEGCIEQFIEAVSEASGVLVARCSPLQKADIVLAVRRSGLVTCAIGDGGNDVGMIQSADVGIGVVGKEGLQAALASDFSVSEFKHIKKLLLWHGRQSLKRSSMLAQFIMHRGMLISTTQALFIMFFGFVEVSMYSGVLLLGYSTAFTMFPVFSLILDRDLDEQLAVDYPELYDSLQRGRDLSVRSFLGWALLSLYQGLVIMVLALLLFPDTSIYLVEAIAFSALILIEYANVLSSIRKIHPLMVLTTLLSAAVYALTLFVFRESLHLYTMDLQFVSKLVFIALIAWLVPFLLRTLLTHLDPSDYEKVMMGNKYRH